MAHVEVAATALLGEIASVLHKTVGAAAEELFRSIVDGVRVRIRGMQRHTVAIALLRRDLQSVVAGIRDIGTELDRPKCRIGNDAGPRSSSREELLVEIKQRGKIGAFGSNVVG